MDRTRGPVLEALDIVQRVPITASGGPGHDMGQGAGDDVPAPLGSRAFEADVLTPGGLDDRSESAQVTRRAWALAALAAGIDLRVVPPTVDREPDLEHGVDPAVPRDPLDACPNAKAVVVSPSFHGITSDIPALAAVCHAHGVPPVVDGAWGAAHPFCSGLPETACRQGANVTVASVHETMGALAQDSIAVVGGELVDPGRFILAFESFRTTSPSVPILASIDTARHRHVRNGEASWIAVLDEAREARRRLATIDGIQVRGRELLGDSGAVDLDEPKLVFSVKVLELTGFQADEWLQRERRVGPVPADVDHVLAVSGIGTTVDDVDRLVDAVSALAAAARAGTDERLRRPAMPIPSVADLDVEMAMPVAAASHAPFEVIPPTDPVGHIAAEIAGPSPPEVPRLIPGQRIGDVHVRHLFGCLEAGAYLPDPASHGKDRIRVLRADWCRPAATIPARRNRPPPATVGTDAASPPTG